MSGIEVAGLVLGAFPIIITALDKWRASAEVWDDWWQIKREYKKCRRDLGCAEIELEVSLQRFLLPLLVDDDEIEALMLEPGGSRWSEPRLDDMLQKRLPRSYGLFIETIRDISDTVDQIKDEVGIERAEFLDLIVGQSHTDKGLTSQKALSKWFSRMRTSDGSIENQKSFSKNLGAQAQRTRFAFRRKERDKLFNELSRNNRRLQTLLDTNEKSMQLTTAREETKKSKAAEGIFTLWRHAERIYDLLTTSFRCQCKDLHRLHLRLCHQTKFTRVEFYFQLIYGIRDTDKPWSRRAFTARKLEAPECTISVTTISPRPPSASTKTEIPVKSAIRQKGKSTATSEPKSAGDASSNAIVVSKTKVGFKDARSAVTSPPKPDAPSIPLIDDVCKTIATTSSDSEYLGMLQTKDALDDEKFVLLSPTSQEGQDPLTKDVCSLAELLLQSNTARLTRQQRYRIALTLASSHVQLFSTPWLIGWQKSKVLVSPGSPSELYMLHSIGEASSPSRPPNSLRGIYSSTITSRATALQSLGIVLLELCYGVAIEDYHVRKALHVPNATPEINAALDLAAAQSWAPNVAGEGGEKFADAVQWCLSGGGREEEQKRWRKEVWSNVVEKLQWSLEQF